MKETHVVLLCVASFVLGSLSLYTQNYGELHRKPCIANYGTHSHPWFADMHQEGLDDTEQRVWFEGTPDERVMSRREWIIELTTHLQENTDMTDHIVQGESIVTDDNLYYVPHGCYAEDLNSFNGPTLWRF